MTLNPGLISVINLHFSVIEASGTKYSHFTGSARAFYYSFLMYSSAIITPFANPPTTDF